MAYYGYNQLKTIRGGSRYKHVQKRVDPNGVVRWFSKLSYRSSKEYPSEREAAIAVDRTLISDGKDPVNILKRING
jgi:hypothetical protein